MRVEIAACILAFSLAMLLPRSATLVHLHDAGAMPRSVVFDNDVFDNDVFDRHAFDRHEAGRASPVPPRPDARGAALERVEYNKNAKDEKAIDFVRLQGIW